AATGEGDKNRPLLTHHAPLAFRSFGAIAKASRCRAASLRYSVPSRRVGLATSRPEPFVRRELRVGVPFRQALKIQRSIGSLVQEFDILQIQFGADFVIDVEVRQIWLGRRAALAFALHLPEQLFEPARQRRDVAKDARLAPEPQLVAMPNKALRIPAERNRALHVLFGRAADQVPEASGGDHAAAKPGGEAPP